jgi:hypothetical protein
MTISDEINKYIKTQKSIKMQESTKKEDFTNKKDSILIQSNIKFENQFKPLRTGDNNVDFYKNVFSLNSPNTYIKSVTVNDIYPYNQFKLFQKDSNQIYFSQDGNRRDNTIIIRDEDANITGAYAKAKIELEPFNDIIKNETTIGGISFTDSVDRDYFEKSLTYKNNNYLENTNIRPEALDGIPISYEVRPREKSQEDRRGYGVNSIRLDSNGKTNKTGLKGEGISTKCENIKLTKFKMKSYRDQKPEDYLKTTGLHVKTEMRNGQTTNATMREDYNNYISNAKNIANKTVYVNGQAANATAREDTNDYISNAKNIADKPQ